MIARAHAAIAACLVGLVAACDSGTPLEVSCEGQSVGGCRPREFVELRALTLDPTSLRRDDVFADLVVHAELGRCAGATATSVGVRIEAEYMAEGSVRVLPLFSLLDDGMLGDPAAGDGVVDRAVQNPFTGLVPVGPLLMRGRGFSPSCESREVVEVDFALLPAP